jgi:hypothetical protein
LVDLYLVLITPEAVVVDPPMLMLLVGKVAAVPDRQLKVTALPQL